MITVTASHLTHLTSPLVRRAELDLSAPVLEALLSAANLPSGDAGPTVYVVGLGRSFFARRATGPVEGSRRIGGVSHATSPRCLTGGER